MTDYRSLPDLPGCYLYKDDDGTVIYVGKAKNLKKRVASYFTKSDHDPKTAALIRSIRDIDYIVTDTEVEALILENSLIKRYRPKYNIDLKDSKSYAFISLSDGPFPRIGIARGKQGSGTRFGPFVSGKERDHVLQVVKKTFKLRSCRRMPKRPCLRYHIGTCSAPCKGTISEETYAIQVGRAEEVLKGNAAGLIRSLEEEMMALSRDQEFERALDIRDQIQAIRHLSTRQHIDRKKRTDEDIISYTVRQNVVYLMLFSVFKGTLGEKQEFIFDYKDGAVDEFLVQYYSEYEPPSELILPEPPEEALQEFLSEQKGRKVLITIPLKGEKKNLLDLVDRNIETVFFGGEKKVLSLQKRIGLPDPPNVIECFDISHLAGTAMVGSMVQFRYGRPDKRNYRRFKIQTVEGIDDFAAIHEVVSRRYRRLVDEEEDLPDLIIIDGGKGQLSSAVEALNELGVKVPVISIAKREEELFVPGFPHPLPVKKHDPASLFVQEIRDEAHRFAITYNRLLRQKKVGA
ncbi:excinuclease ABC subunit C [Methanomicrobiaceae archaeon CYW5]|uniref:excinuclease ABC subunit UvrC n=1 Tax=Methanovulcanius yangii TaxID=1789227 RepID=UPI0029CA5F82|nr:excinuclease ABC subunit UvrC [Methanovulcanius yangii]MBT8507329.1 excinuclease ABC subunit C [Methanovulcanius yangii]